MFIFAAITFFWFAMTVVFAASSRSDESEDGSTIPRAMFYSIGILLAVAFPVAYMIVSIFQ